MNRLQAGRLATRLLPWALLIAAAVLVTTHVSRPASLFELWRPWAEIGAVAAVMTAVILTGGIDLSVGSVVALCGVVLGTLWHGHGWPIELAALAALATGLAAGAVNGALVIAGMAPLVATLATMACYAGLAMAVSGGQRIAGLPGDFTALGQGSVLGLPAQIWLLAAVFAAAFIVVHHTRAGRYMFAIGDNRLAAAMAAVPTTRVEWTLYAATGFVAGLVSLTYTARGGAAIPTAGVGLELQTIACVVVGGTRITGGYGGVGRTLVGVAAMANLDLGLQLLGAQRLRVPWTEITWQLNANGRMIVIGALLIAVAVWNERMAPRRR